MPKQFNRQSLKQQILYLLTTAPDGMGSRKLLHKIRPKISQLTLSRMLVELRADGEVHKVGEACATRYFATGGWNWFRERRIRNNFSGCSLALC